MDEWREKTNLEKAIARLNISETGDKGEFGGGGRGQKWGNGGVTMKSLVSKNG